ncbi:MAG: hypothetical protein WBC06_11915 [Chitinophagaceae bacterium]
MKKINKSFLFRLWFLNLYILPLGFQVQSQKYDGNYRGSFTGQVYGTFEFTVNNAHKTGMEANLEGTFKFSDGTLSKIHGRVDQNGKIDALFVTPNEVTHSTTTGMFRGKISGGICWGDYKVYVQTSEKLVTSVGSWTTQDKETEKEILSYSILLGKDLLITDPKPIALRIHIRLNEKYKEHFSIKMITVGSVNTIPGRYAADVNFADDFYVYTDWDGLFVDPPSGAKEADYDFQYVNFGTKQDIVLPKNFTAKIHVKLKSETDLYADQEEVLMIPFQISALCNVVVQNCGFGECPTLNNKKIKKLESAPAVSGDKVLIPMDAEVCMKFLDGTLSYFINRSQTPWLLTMGAGHFSSEQNWKNTDNTITIDGVAMKGLEAAGDKLSDKALEAGLRMLILKGSSVSAPGVILQLSQFVSADIMAAQPVVIRLRSKLEIMFYANGTYRIRNLEGSPEVLRKKNHPLLIPVGKEVMVDQKGVVSDPVKIGINPTEPPVKNKLEPVIWRGTWQTKWGPMIITQSGNNITGTYGHDNGKVKGTITGNKLTGTWSEAPTYLPPKDAGEFEFTLSVDGKSFTGRWRYGNKGEWQIGWDGHN